MNSLITPPNAFHSEFEYKQACDLYRYWLALPVGKPRQAVDPIAVGARLIAHLNLLSRNDGGDFRYDLVGSVLQDTVPRLKPGAMAGAIMVADPTRNFIFSRLTACADSAQPGGFRTQFETIEGKPIALLTFHYPLDIAGGHAASLLLGVWTCRTDEALLSGERRNDVIDNVHAWLFDG